MRQQQVMARFIGVRLRRSRLCFAMPVAGQPRDWCPRLSKMVYTFSSISTVTPAVHATRCSRPDLRQSRCRSWDSQGPWVLNGATTSLLMKQQSRLTHSDRGDETSISRIKWWMATTAATRRSGCMERTSSTAEILSSVAIIARARPMRARRDIRGTRSRRGDGRCVRSCSRLCLKVQSYLATSISCTR